MKSHTHRLKGRNNEIDFDLNRRRFVLETLKEFLAHSLNSIATLISLFFPSEQEGTLQGTGEKGMEKDLRYQRKGIQQLECRCSPSPSKEGGWRTSCPSEIGRQTFWMVTRSPVKGLRARTSP